MAGNERADEIAVSFSKAKTVSLFDGHKSDYSFSIEKIPSDTSLPNKNRSIKKPKAKAWYISFVDGVVTRHDQWSECEQRVKGRSGAKFKKVSSLAEEKELFSKWSYWRILEKYTSSIYDSGKLTRHNERSLIILGK